MVRDWKLKGTVAQKLPQLAQHAILWTMSMYVCEQGSPIVMTCKAI